jgi:hypothetical protein
MEYFETQSLRQEGNWDCGVEVFSKLAGVSRTKLFAGTAGSDQWYLSVPMGKLAQNERCQIRET